MHVDEIRDELGRRQYQCRICDYQWWTHDRRRPRACSVCGSVSLARVTGESLRGDGYRAQLEAVLKTLTYREREILKLRFGIEGGCSYTLREVGRIFKCRHSSIWREQAKAVQKLRHPKRAAALMNGGLSSRYARLTMPEGMNRLITAILG